MKKNRNSFFAENNMNYQGFNPMTGGYQLNSNTGFYAGNINNQNDLLERLSRIERNINKLDHRLNKLESMQVHSTDNLDVNTDNMYMI